MLQVKNHEPKCDGQDSTGNNVCQHRNNCGRFLRPAGDNQVKRDFWKQGENCIEYESVPAQYRIEVEEPAKVGWD